MRQQKKLTCQELVNGEKVALDMPTRMRFFLNIDRSRSGQLLQSSCLVNSRRSADLDASIRIRLSKIFGVLTILFIRTPQGGATLIG